MGQSGAGDPAEGRSDGPDWLERGREHYERREWADAFQVLSRADEAADLAPGDLELLAMSAYLVGRDDDYLRTLERAHQAHLDRHERHRAVRCAFWLGFQLFLRGEVGRATGWFARGQRLLEGENECAEQGYMLVPVVDEHIAAGEWEAAYECAARAAEIGERCGDADLVACTRYQQGLIRVEQGRVQEGLALLDEVMVAVTAGELSLMMTGLMYCGVIQACMAVYAIGRAGEWTAALARWCEPDFAPFTGVCRVHRAEIRLLHGDWHGAIEEAHRARERARDLERTVAAAFYQQAEVHRLRGEFAAAERAYRSASRGGFDPQPGLALLRLAEGSVDAAAAAIGRALGATTGSSRARAAAAGLRRDHAGGRRSAGRGGALRRAGNDGAELRHRRAGGDGGAGARGDPARQRRGRGGAVLAAQRVRSLAAGRGSVPRGAGARARRVGLPEPRRRRGRGAGVGGRRDGLPQARRRARSRPARCARDGRRSNRSHGLTNRELQVLRLVAAGGTNKAIAAELFLSERTIERHLSNIFTKLDLSTRAGATAWAYEHRLI